MDGLKYVERRGGMRRILLGMRWRVMMIAAGYSSRYGNRRLKRWAADVNDIVGAKD